jgi:hypothetical protein
MTNRTYKIGHCREQISLLPACLEDYVGADNPVRAIDSYVDSLDLMGLGFCDVGSDAQSAKKRSLFLPGGSCPNNRVQGSSRRYQAGSLPNRHRYQRSRVRA